MPWAFRGITCFHRYFQFHCTAWLTSSLRKNHRYRFEVMSSLPDHNLPLPALSHLTFPLCLFYPCFRLPTILRVFACLTLALCTYTPTHPQHAHPPTTNTFLSQGSRHTHTLCGHIHMQAPLPSNHNTHTRTHADSCNASLTILLSFSLYMFWMPLWHITSNSVNDWRRREANRRWELAGCYNLR